MTVFDAQGRPEPAEVADEETTLFGFLNFLRATLKWKTDGLSDAQLRYSHAPSSMTLGGMLRHMAYIEDWWLCQVIGGNAPSEPWASVDWDSENDWDWTSANDAGGDELRAEWQQAVDYSNDVWRHFVDSGQSLDSVVAVPYGRGNRSARWVVTHMIEEYARHCGHADLFREAIDGETGE